MGISLSIYYPEDSMHRMPPYDCLLGLKIPISLDTVPDPLPPPRSQAYPRGLFLRHRCHQRAAHVMHQTRHAWMNMSHAVLKVIRATARLT